MTRVQVALVGEQAGGPLQGLRADPFDRLVLLHSSSPKSREAAGKVRAAAEAMQVSPGGIELIAIDPFDLSDVLNRVVAVRHRHPKAEITVHISGGTNIMASGALVGCFILGAEAIYIRQAQPGEDDSLAPRVVRLPVPRVPLDRVKGPKLRILQALVGPRGTPLSLEQGRLGQSIEMTPQLISAHMKQLAKWDLV